MVKTNGGGCPYCGKSIDIIKGPREYKYDKRIKKVTHMECYIENGGKEWEEKQRAKCALCVGSH